MDKHRRYLQDMRHRRGRLDHSVCDIRCIEGVAPCESVDGVDDRVGAAADVQSVLGSLKGFATQQRVEGLSTQDLIG